MQKKCSYDFSKPSNVKTFRNHIYSYFEKYGRQLPWRTDYNPYHIFVSEVMLQQTQVERVKLKFPGFINKYPDFSMLAKSRLEDVFEVWQGLGYNRRASALRDSAKIIVSDYNGILPDNPELLQKLPGIGKATASSIVAFAFNKPVVFLETNIRTIFINHFFPDDNSVSDDLILPLATIALDKSNPRRWYSALMDYGTMLKKEFGNLSKQSKTYKKQTPFKGSQRQMRGAVLKLLLKHKKLTLANFEQLTEYTRPSLEEILLQLEKENLVKENKEFYRIAE